jgi:hypothetical protein
MNFIQEYYLKQQLNSFVEKRKKGQRNIYALKETESVCFFHTYDTFEKLEELMRYTSFFYNKQKRRIICYLPPDGFIENQINTKLVCVVAQKAISLAGQLNKQVREKIFSQHYDVFIDTDIKSDLSALYLKTFIDANFRIGRNPEYSKYYDFTLCVGEQYTIKEYMTNLEIYTLKLKGI